MIPRYRAVGVSEKKLMTKQFWNVLKLSPIVLAAMFCAAKSTLAAEVNKTDATQENLGQVTSVSRVAQSSKENLGQVTSVSQFSDVQPTDWAFQALQSLVERYGCIAGYPNGTYRGNRAMTRYEFAAGLNACLDRVNELIATATADVVKKEDLATLQRLQEEFAAELATLRGRVDALEARTAELEANQFSTTTKLVGEAIFSVSDAFGSGNQAVSARTLRNNPNFQAGPLNSNVVFSDRVRLSLNSSFTGKDNLQIRLQAGNTVNNSNSIYGTGATGTQQTRLAYDGFDTNGASANNSVFIDKINYAFNLKDSIRVKIDANTGEFYENVDTHNPDFKSSGTGALSRYGRFSPIYRQGQGGAGATITFAPKGPLGASIGYLGGGRYNDANSPIGGQGLFNGNYAALGQIDIKPAKAFNIGLTYVHSYQTPVDGNNSSTALATNLSEFEGTGSTFASNPFGSFTNANNVSIAANHYGIEFTFAANSKFTLAGWGGYSTLEAKSGGISGAQAQAYYWGTTLAVKDFGRPGNVLGLIFGTPPKVTYNDLTINGIRQNDKNTTYQLEGLYKFQVSDHISVTPGIIVLFNPEDNTKNDTEYVGTLRTTFTF